MPNGLWGHFWFLISEFWDSDADFNGKPVGCQFDLFNNDIFWPRPRLRRERERRLQLRFRPSQSQTKDLSHKLYDILQKSRQECHQWNKSICLHANVDGVALTLNEKVLSKFINKKLYYNLDLIELIELNF